MSSLPGRGRGHRAGGRSARLLFPMPQPVPADRLLKRARKHGVTEAEAIELTEAWKRAARKTKRLHLVDGRQ
jgi:hypothetical protein